MNASQPNNEQRAIDDKGKSKKQKNSMFLHVFSKLLQQTMQKK